MRLIDRRDCRWKRRRIRLVTWIILGGWLVYHLLTLGLYRYVKCDEGNYAAVAYQFLQTGQYTLPIGPTAAPSHANMAAVGRLFATGEAFALWIGGPHLYTVRAYTLVAWGLTAILLYLIGRRLHGEETGALAALAYGLSVSSYVRSHIARPDGWAAAIVVATYWLYLRAKEKPSFWRVCLIGLVGVLAIDFYAVAVYFILPMALLVLIQFGLRQRRFRLLLAYGLGVLVGGVFFVAVHAYPDAASAYQVFLRVAANPHYNPTASSLASTLSAAAWWLRDFLWEGNRHMAAMETLLAIGGALIAAHRRIPGGREITTLICLSLLPFVLLFHDKQWSHLIFWLPFGALWIAMGGAEAARWLSARIGRRLSGTVLLAPWLALNVAAGLYLGYTHRTHDFEAHLAEIREMIPPGATYMGRGIYWFAYPGESRFLHELALTWLRQQYPDGVDAQTLDSFLRDEGVEYLILDDGFECTQPFLQPPNATLAGWAEANCVLVGYIPATPWYGEGAPKPVYFCED